MQTLHGMHDLEELIQGAEADSEDEFLIRLQNLLKELAGAPHSGVWLDVHEYVVRWESKVVELDNTTINKLWLACMVMVYAMPARPKF